MWWNNSYLFRREVQLNTSTKIEAGHIVEVLLPDSFVTNNLIREDYADLEVVYDNDTDNEVLVLPREIYETDDGLELRFNLQDPFFPFSDAFGRYNVYYTNPTLENAVRDSVDDFEQDLYPVKIGHDSGLISFTKPGQHWVDGVSSTYGSRASFEFKGKRFKVVSNKGPDFGSLFVSINGSDIESISLQGRSEQEVEIYSKEYDSTVDGTNFLLRLTAQEAEKQVNVVRIEYAHNLQATFLEEQAKENISWAGFTNNS